MRTIHVIGIGSGDPDHLTLQAVRALRDCSVVLVVDKGEATSELVAVRQAICEEHIAGSYRVVTIPEQTRDRGAADYAGAVTDWYAARAGAFDAALAIEVGEDEQAAVLVWGDPALYDSTLRVLDLVTVPHVREVVPGISCLSALAAAHGITFTGVGAPVHVTTGRRLGLSGMPTDLDAVWVMLDGPGAFALLADTDLDIYWGAYVGMPDELLVAGDLQACKDRILELRTVARERKGWIMDCYLLRRRSA